MAPGQPPPNRPGRVRPGLERALGGRRRTRGGGAGGPRAPGRGGVGFPRPGKRVRVRMRASARRYLASQERRGRSESKI